MSTPDQPPATRIVGVPIAEARAGDWVTLYEPKSFAEPIRAKIVELGWALYAAGCVVLYKSTRGPWVVGDTVEREVLIVTIPTEVGVVFRAKLTDGDRTHVFRVEDKTVLPYRIISSMPSLWYTASGIDPATVELGRIEFIPTL